MAHPLSGADIGTLHAVFRMNGGAVHWGRTASIWAAALARAPFSMLERALIAPHLPRTEDMEPPIFILGHWRSGTTHLYNIMSHDRWGYVPPVAAGLPWDMFGLARLLRPMLERALPAHRWIDRMPVTPTSPQEDEVAIASMSPLSFYHGIYFPRNFDALIDRGLFFDGCSAQDIQGWQNRFTYFLRKLSHDQGARLLIKNPVYTGRVALLRQIFPGAKFIHIHRNPFDVFLSMRNFYARLLKELAVQDIPGDLDIDATILRVYARMMHAFERDTADLGAPDFVELPYEMLDHEPLAALELIYGTLELGGLAQARPRFVHYLEGVKSFRKNAFAGDRAMMDKVECHLGYWINKWGYPSSHPADAA